MSTDALYKRVARILEEARSQVARSTSKLDKRYLEELGFR